MHLALKAYQELLLNLNEMDHSQDEDIRQSSNIIKSKMLPALLPNIFASVVYFPPCLCLMAWNSISR